MAASAVRARLRSNDIRVLLIFIVISNHGAAKWIFGGFRRPDRPGRRLFPRGDHGCLRRKKIARRRRGAVVMPVYTGAVPEIAAPARRNGANARLDLELWMRQGNDVSSISDFSGAWLEAGAA
jgi:hypothetical protein